MNERIKELHGQAYLYALHNETKAREGGSHEPRTFDNDYREKFAELIVKECLGIVANADMTGSWITHPKDVLYVACDQVKKHFGVE
jgi:hypothetical protein